MFEGISKAVSLSRGCLCTREGFKLSDLIFGKYPLLDDHSVLDEQKTWDHFDDKILLLLFR